MKIPSLSLSVLKIRKNRKVPEIAMTPGLVAGRPSENPEAHEKNSENTVLVNPNVTNSIIMEIQSHQPLSLPDYIPEYISRPTSDDESVSTLGSTEFICPNKPGSSRSIFRDYWKADENPPSSSMPASTPSQSQATVIETDSSNLSRYTETIMNSRDWSSYINEEIIDPHRRKKHSSDNRLRSEYEAFLKENEAGRTTMPAATLLNDGDGSNIRIHSKPSTIIHTPQMLQDSFSKIPVNRPARRKIFNRRYGPNKPPTLPSYGYIYDKPNKHAPPVPFALTLRGKKLLRSSMRRDRSTSLSEATTLEESFLSSQSRPSVSFERKVTVHEIDKPHGQWVHDGWSERFL